MEQKYVKATPHWITDHPGCEEKLWLPAHGSYEWSQSVTVPEVPPGSARVHVSVQVIGLKNCDRYGCDSVNVTTSFSPVAIVPPSN